MKKFFKACKKNLATFKKNVVNFFTNSTFINKAKKTKPVLLFKKTNKMLLPYTILMILLIVIPLVIILFYSLIGATGNSLIFEINFKNFLDFFREGSFMISLLLSLGFALAAALIAIVIGYPVAYIMAFSNSKFLTKNIWILVTLPIWINMILKVIGLQTLFQIISPTLIGTPISIILGMVYAFIPFVILPIYNSLEKTDRTLIEASRDLGAGHIKTFWKVTFRQSLPGVITGGILLLVQASTSLIIFKFLGGGQISSIVQVIESYFFKGGNFGLGAAISVVMALIIFIIIIVSKYAAHYFENNKRKVKN
ncbi:ABC transporter permease [Spiroplasma endosymbiont of Anurida maritima]|uniref:spermidine/putrescine ABC transporter permease n=1 Tax=Spiroplasma endosymbiont of Anurida maritima TaxID=2967972 RepID=UPI0036D2ED63